MATYATVLSSSSQFDHRDIRSASLPFKRTKDHDEKWSMGMRPSGGVRLRQRCGPLGCDELEGGSESQREKVRPMKQWSQMTSDYKSHANKTPKPTAHSRYGQEGISSRITRKVDAVIDANDHTGTPLSNSLLDLLPQHANNIDLSIQTTIVEAGNADAGVLYSYDHKGVSPGERGREVHLGGLIDQAEKRWMSEQTDRIVKGEYEVLDVDGETTVLPSAKGRKRGSPKQRALKSEPAGVAHALEEDDGFELV